MVYLERSSRLLEKLSSPPSESNNLEEEAKQKLKKERTEAKRIVRYDDV